MSNTKYIQIAELIRRRIKNGDYSFSDLPGAQKLALETGVSYLTARQAVQYLINDGILHRLSTGRLEIVSGSQPADRKRLNVCYIRPSGEVAIWDEVLPHVAKATGSNYRTIYYSHNDDPLLFDGLDGDFDLIFLQFNRTDRLFIEKLSKIKNRLVTMFQDFSHLGIRCLDGPSPTSITKLAKYLYDLGHRKFSFFNTEPQTPALEQRLHYWREEVNRLGCGTAVYNFAVKPFSPSHYHAYQEMTRLLKSGKFDSTAMFATTVNVTTGIIRSCHENGMNIPADLSLCSFGNPDRALLTIPSVTIIERPDPTPEVTKLFHVFSGLEPDSGELVFRTAGCDILPGESTGLAPGCKVMPRIAKHRKNNHKIEEEIVS